MERAASSRSMLILGRHDSFKIAPPNDPAQRLSKCRRDTPTAPAV